MAQLLDRRIEAANVFGMQSYIVEQQGFRKVVDTSFMIGFLISGEDVDMQDVEKYFRALQRAQRDIDVEHQQYTHYYLREMADEFKPLVDVRAFGPGERLVFEPYTQRGLRADPPLDEEARAVPRGPAGRSRLHAPPSSSSYATGARGATPFAPPKAVVP